MGNCGSILEQLFKELAVQKECTVIEGHLIAGPCPHVDLDTAEVCGVAGRRFHQG